MSQLTKKPKRKLIRLASDAYGKPETWYFVTICCRKKQLLFNTASCRDIVVQALEATADLHSVEVAAYTVLSNHLHLISSAGDKGLISFVRSFKLRVTTQFRNRLKQSSPWQRSFFDHKIRHDESLQQKCHYVWANPVRAGLVKAPEEYRWSGSMLTG
jgi:putative transposase